MTGSCKGPIHCLCTDYENKTFVDVLSGNLSPFISFTLHKITKLNLEKYHLAEIVQLSTRVVIFESLFLGGHMRRHGPVAVMSHPFNTRANP